MTVDVTGHLSPIGQRIEADPLAPLFGLIIAASADPHFISLAVGSPDNNLLSVELARDLFNAALDTYGPRVLNYAKPDGLPDLAQAYVARGAQWGLRFNPDEQQVLVTSGGMEAISMASQALVSPGDVVLVEAPAFAGAISTFKLWGAKVVHVQTDDQGMDPEALSAAIREHRPKLVLLMPDGQNPGGSTMPLERRQQIAELLTEHQVFAIEDHAYAHLRYDGLHTPPLQSMSEYVILADSMSKVLDPAARIGFLVSSPRLVSEIANLKSAFNMQASALWQAMVERYLSTETNYWDTNVAKLVAEYRQRRDAMVAAVREHFPADKGFHFTEPQGGMFLWLEAPERVDFVSLFDQAVANGVAYVPGNVYYEDGIRGRNAARLNFASTPAEKIPEAINRLAQTVEARL